MWRFLSNNEKENIPNIWVEFFKNHSKRKFPNKELVYGINRDTKTEWLNWRKEIKNSTHLKEIENYCNSSLNAFGYNLFGSIAITRNLSVPSLKSTQECPTIPC